MVRRSKDSLLVLRYFEYFMTVQRWLVLSYTDLLLVGRNCGAALSIGILSGNMDGFFACMAEVVLKAKARS